MEQLEEVLLKNDMCEEGSVEAFPISESYHKNPRCANGVHTKNCQPDPKPNDSSSKTSSSEENEPPNKVTELSAAKTPTSSSHQFSTTPSILETTSANYDSASSAVQNASNVYDESTSSSSSSSTTTTIISATEDIWGLLKPGITVLDGVTIYVCSESTTSTKILPTTPLKSTTVSPASTTTTSASDSSTSLKTPKSSTSSGTSTSKIPTSSDSTSSKSQVSSSFISSTTSSTSTASQEKSTTPIPSKTASKNIQTPTISHESSETSSSRSSSTRTRSSLDSTGSSSGSTESSSTSTQTTPAISSSSATSSFTSLASTSPALTSTSSSSSSSTSPSTKAGTHDVKPSSTTKPTTNKISATSSKSPEASTFSGTDSTSLPKTSVTSSNDPVVTSSERITTENFKTSTGFSFSEATSPASSERTSSSSSIIITPTASKLTSTPTEDISSSSESSEPFSKITTTEPNAFPTTTFESETTSESHSTLLPATSSTSSVGSKRTSSIIQITMETSSVGSPSITTAETPDTETRTSPKSLKTTPGNSENTTTGARSTSVSSSITEFTSSSTAPSRSSSSSVTSSGTTGTSSSSTFIPSSSSSVTTSGTSESADTDHSTASSSSVSELTTTQSTPITESAKLQTTTTEATVGLSTAPKVEPSTGGSTSTTQSTTRESPLTEEKSSTSFGKPQPSTTSPTTSDMLISTESSTSYPTTTDSTTSIFQKSSTSEDPPTMLDDGTTQTTSKQPEITSELPKSTEAFPATSSSISETSPKITSTLSTPKTSSMPKPVSEITKTISQKSSTENPSSFKTTLSKETLKSSTTSTFTKSTTPIPSTVSRQTSTPKSTTTDPLCSQQCPDGYLVGTSYCFRLFPRLVSYQSALAYCKTIDRQTLASLDKIKDNSDIKLIQESAALQNVDWIYANGIGAKDERFLKKASVYSIYNQSLVSSPIVKTIGISQLFTNISALCVMPQYCNMMDCDVEKIFQAYEFYNNFKQTAGTLEPRRSGTVTCIYGNQKSTTVTCNTLGAMYPNPTNIDCEESATERQLKDTINDIVPNCKSCYKRGTKECQTVLNETNQEVKGYQCICKEPYSMSTCWRTVNNCNSTVCGDHGTCMSEMGHMWCDCKWGYTGDHCDEALDEKYDGDIGFSSAVGATITVGDGIFRFLKICVMGLPKRDGGFDAQSTHQTFRWVCILCANALITLYSNPTLLAIPLIQCRFTFIAIHFFYVQAMVQWLLEGFNVNQVLRCVHLNEWERDINGNKSLGVRIWPRFIVSVIGVAVFVLIPFTAGWNKLAASWTCVGVICQETLHVWFPIFFGVLVIVLWAGAVYENSALIKVRRPLLGFRLDYEIERRVGWEAGKIFQKCRDNELVCFIGVILLVAQWVSVIISSDHRDEKFYGMITVVVSGIYFAFSTYQEIMTNPEDRANFYTLLQRFLPFRAAPAYNPETTWTIDEVKEYFNTPKKEREEQYEGFINRNQQLFIHHKWDIRMNEFLAEDLKMTIDEALIKVFTVEMNDLKKNNGSGREKLYIQATFVAYCDTIPHFEPRPTEKLQGHLELVTLAAEDPVHGTRLAKFFIVPTHHIFEPEISEKKKGTKESRKRKNLRRRMLKNIEEDIFKLSREEIHAQAVFANSAILFSHYGNDVVR
ncbi:hypothetical protein L5515_005003 [Caenorhabditis briggsae]|uniref:EGF-like domain-containing protein n=1 Tax=Caenorhabditis briggsae TaxID=6238 RepID=A0AAE9JCM6_CAEBR|nr:hypothetical protein L5515_005003 [Caenorhabditis briggsae]